MNKKKLVAGLLASASVLGICLSGGTALATEVSSQDTEVGIGFGEHIKGVPGDLEIKWLPKEFNFGSGHTPDAANSKSYSAEGAAKKYIVVSDARDDLPQYNQWMVTASLSKLQTTGGNELAGAELSFDGEVKGYAGNKAPEDPSSVIAADPAKHTAVVVASPTLAQGGAAEKVMEDDGKGTSSYKGKTAMEMTNIKLTVPGGVALENASYTGKVTWSLDDTII